MTTIRQRSEDYLRKNQQLEETLRGAGRLPESYTSTLGKKAGGQNLLERIGDFLGVFKPSVTEESLLEQRQGNFCMLSGAYDDLLESQKQETKSETKADDQEVFDTSLDRSIQQALAEGAIAEQLLKTAGQISTDQSVAQAQALLPIIDQASARGLSRNLAASKDFLAFKQQQPLAQQAIMASKQQQMTGAADAFLKEAMAIATQQQAANQFGSLGTGRRFG